MIRLYNHAAAQHHLVHDTENTLNQVVQQARDGEQQLNQRLTVTSEQVCIVHELVIVFN